MGIGQINAIKWLEDDPKPMAGLKYVSFEYATACVKSALVDGGAQASCILKTELKQLLSADNTKISMMRRHHALSGASGASLKACGTARIQFKLSGIKFSHDFVVCENLNHGILLGEDFLIAELNNVNYQRKTLVLKNGKHVPFWRRGDAVVSAVVSATSKVRIPPHTSKLVQVQARNFVHGHTTAIFTPKEVKERQFGAQIVELDDGQTQILCENRNPWEITVYPVELGTLTELRGASIYTVQEFQRECNAGNVEGKVVTDGIALPVTGGARRALRRAAAAQRGAHDPTVNTLSHKSTDRTDHPEGVLAQANSSLGQPQSVSEKVDSTGPNSDQKTDARVKGTALPPGFQLEENLTPDQKRRVADLVARYKQSFILYDGDHGLTDVLEHTIELIDKKPINKRQYPMDHERAKALEEIGEQLENAGKIEDSISPWNSPVLVVKKPNGKGWRIVNDFRLLNEVTEKMEWPIPDVQESLDSLAGNSWYTTVDMKDAFFQVPLKREHRQYTAFNLGSRHVQYKVMPQGLCNSTATFQRLMSVILRKLPNYGKWCIPYVDDLLIFASTFEELLLRTQLVLECLSKAGLKMGGAKTRIGLRRVRFLGHIIDQDGIRMDPDKIEKVQKWPRPVTVTQLRQFLGLCSYHRRFIEGFAEKAHALSCQTGGGKQDLVKWSEAAKEAFDKLKAALCDPTQVLAYPDFSENAEPFIVKTDACRVSEGAVLSQKQNGVERVIAYASRSFPASEQHWGIPQQEAHAIFWACTKEFNYYLRFRAKKFEVRTDHKPCLSMKINKVASERMYRWALALQDYNMDIKHVDGSKHVEADAISRLGYLKALHESKFVESEVRIGTIRADTDGQSFTAGGEAVQAVIANIQTTPTKKLDVEAFDAKHPRQEIVEFDLKELAEHPNLIATLLTQKTIPPARVFPGTVAALSGAGYQHDAIVTAQSQDPSTMHLWQWFKHRTQPPAPHKKQVRKMARRCFIEHDVVYRRGGVYGKQLVLPACLREEVLHSMHDAKWAGHFGQHNTIHRIAKSYWWPGMSADVLKYVRSCTACQTRNFSPQMRVRTPVVDDKVPRLFERLSVDIQGEFTKSRRGNRWIVTFLDIHSRWIEGFCVSSINAEDVARLLVNEIILRYGPTRSLLSDRGSNFTAQIIRETCKLFQIAKIETAAYHPESNAKVERVHRIYSDALSKYVNPSHSDWDEYFPFVQWAYRSSVQNALGASPYTLVFGREPPELADLSLLPPPPMGLEKDVKEWVKTLKTRIEKTQNETAQLQLHVNEKLLATSQHTDKETRVFRVGDRVMVRNEITVHEKETRLTSKWQPRFLGPYVVEACTGMTYTLRCEADASDVRVRNINDIKPYYQRTLRPPATLPGGLPVTGDSHDWNTIDADELEVENILDRRVFERPGRRNEIEYLVRFKNLGHEHDEWYSARDLACAELIAEYENNHDPTTERHVRVTRSGSKYKRPRTG